MKILIFNLYYEPDDTGTGLIVTQLARDLVAQGEEVTVITSVPHYGRDAVPEPYRGKRLHREQRDGVQLLRARVHIARRMNVGGRILNYMSYAVMSLYAGLRAERHDVILCVWPPVTSVMSVLPVALARRVPIVLSVQDIYPRAVLGRGVLRMVNNALESIGVRAARRIAIITRDVQPVLERRGAAAAKFAIISNWVDTEEITPGTSSTAYRSEHGLDASFVVQHAGNLGRFTGVDVVLDAAAALRGDPRARFMIVGRGHHRQALVDRARALELDNLFFLDTQPRDRLPELLATANVGLVTLDPRIATTSVPSRTFGIMAAARPILAVMHENNEVVRIIRKAQCGVHVPPGDSAGLAAAIVELMGAPDRCRAMGENGRRFVEAEFSRSEKVRAYRDLLASTARPDAGRR